MDHLWSPWRYQYVSSEPPVANGCVFCRKAEAGKEEENLVLFRGTHCYVLLNLYPYTNGHLMIAPYEHVDSLAAASPAAAAEMMDLARVAETALRQVYRPGGINLGMNLGACAGAGVAGHIHLHVLPRWPGDANFLSVVGETRVLIEELPVTWQRLREAFASLIS
jgi:ATP adenylyltransferase